MRQANSSLPLRNLPAALAYTFATITPAQVLN
jgi:hypothetical protein